MKKAVSVLVFLLFALAAVAGCVPTIVASVVETTTGNFTLATPSANGNYEMIVYLEASSGTAQTCASVSWYDDNGNPQTSANVCSDSSAKGGFVVPIRAKAGTNIYLNVNSVSQDVYATLESL